MNNLAKHYIEVEITLNRVISAMKSVADKQTIQDLQSVGTIMAEIRHAAVSLSDGSDVDGVTQRVMSGLLNVEEKQMTNIELCEINLRQSKLIEDLCKELKTVKALLATSEKISIELEKQLYESDKAYSTLAKKICTPFKS
jgi:hypothetical protein